MANQTIGGKTLLDLIKKEHRDSNKLRKKSRELLVAVEKHERVIAKLVKKMSPNDVILYEEEFQKMIKQGLVIKF